MSDIILNFITGHISNIIILLLALAFGAILKAIDNLRKEKTILDACKAGYLGKLNPGMDHFDAAIEDGKMAMDDEPDFDMLGSSAHVEKRLEKLMGNSDRLLNSSYMSDRLYAILCSVDKNNLVRKSPPLTDLHELTMQREQGGYCTCIFRSITPTLLIIGIFGTLWGVHQRLGLISDGKISILAEALLPGIMAVLFTIVLMIFRGAYNKRLSEFVSELDRFTLVKLQPFFQPADHLDVTLAALNENMGKMGKLEFERTPERISMLFAITQKRKKLYEILFNSFAEQQKKYGQACINAEKGLKTAASANEKLRAYAEKASTQTEEFSKNLDKAERGIAGLCEHLKSIQQFYCEAVGRLADPRAAYEQAAQATDYKNSISKQDDKSYGLSRIKQVLENSGSICESLQKMDSILNGIWEKSSAMNEFDNSIDQNIDFIATLNNEAREQAKKTKKEFEKVLENFKSISDQICKNVEDTRSLIDQKLVQAKGLRKLGEGNSYPKGWEGIKMRLLDLLNTAKEKVYGSLSGRLAIAGIFLVVAEWAFLPLLLKAF